MERKYEYDSDGRIVSETYGDFKELTTYYDDGSKRIETYYPNGYVEVEKYN